MTQPILVTGGAGYIGSHTVLELLKAGHPVTVLDNLSNANPEALARVQELAGREVAFCRADVRDRAALDGLFRAQPIHAVIHFAGLKAVGESTGQPLRYYQNNVAGTLTLLEAMEAAGCRNLVFSSSATVYGDPAALPITEDMPLSATNPYGQSKLIIEDICRDLAKADPRWHLALLRYFNPVGAHPSGRIGEDPLGTPNNLMPYLLQVASGRRPHLSIFGRDYPTPDGTGIRDYIHVMDLARGHLAALKALPELPGATAINLGTGRGCSVLELVAAMEVATGFPIPRQFAPRRPGDIASCYADCGSAERLLDWRATQDQGDMCRDAWSWQRLNPDGYRSQLTKGML